MKSLRPLPSLTPSLVSTLALVLPLLTQAAPSPCQPPPAQSRLEFSALGGGAQAAPPAGAELTLTRTRAAWHPARPDSGVALGYGHEYSVTDLERVSAAHPERSGNGHFHHLYLPVDLSGLLPSAWSLRLQPALAVTSNQLRHPDKIDSRDWQFNAALFHRWGDPARDNWELGLCADARFGEPRLYPSLAWRHDSAAWSLRLGLPDAFVTRRLGAGLDAGLRLFPDGNRWRVHDDETSASWHEHQAWRAEAVLGWDASRAWRLEAGLGAWLRSRHDFELRDGRQLSGEQDESAYLRVDLIWRPGR